MKKIFWFRLDCDFLADDKLQDILFDIGPNGVLVYIQAVAMLYKNGGYLSKDKYDKIAYACHTDRAVVVDIVENYDLFEVDGERFWSKRALDEIEYAKRISEVKARAGRASGEQRRNKTGTGDEHMFNGCSAYVEPSTITITDIDNNSDKSDIVDKDNISDESLLPMNIDTIPLITPEELKDMWNNGRGKCAKILAITDERRQKAELRLEEFGKSRVEQEQTILALMAKIRDSELLQSQSWCNFDWLIKNSTNWVKVMEDKYRNSDIRSGVKDIRDIKDVNDLWKD